MTNEEAEKRIVAMINSKENQIKLMELPEELSSLIKQDIEVLKIAKGIFLREINKEKKHKKMTNEEIINVNEIQIRILERMIEHCTFTESEQDAIHYGIDALLERIRRLKGTEPGKEPEGMKTVQVEDNKAYSEDYDQKDEPVETVSLKIEVDYSEVNECFERIGELDDRIDQLKKSYSEFKKMVNKND